MILHNIGIQIYQAKLSTEHYNFLLSEYGSIHNRKKRDINANYWGGEVREFCTAMDGEVLVHAREYLKQTQLSNSNLKHVSQWINVQANDGFLGIHDHYGDISYVIYLKVPDFIKNYNDAPVSSMPYAEGMISFIYGHPNSLFPDMLHLPPEEGMIYMFPAQLKHYVYPFKDSSSKRVSVSGNIIFEKS